MYWEITYTQLKNEIINNNKNIIQIILEETQFMIVIIISYSNTLS